MNSIIDVNLQRLISLAQDDVTPNEDLTGLGLVLGDTLQARIIIEHNGTRAALEATGFNVITRIDNIFTGIIAIDQIEALSQADGVVRIEGGTQMTSMDVAVPDVNGDHVLTGPGVGSPPHTYTGNNVIVGIIDSGIDFWHRAFRNSDAAGTTRILSILDWTDNAGPSAPGFISSTVWTRAQINADLASGVPHSVVRQTDAGGHGTHVAAIAAGSLAPTGMAPDADLIIVKTNGADAELSGGIDYIFQQAEALGRPCVINLSMGGQYGAHDGTGLVERHINKRLGTPGHAFITSAGNDGDVDASATATIAPGASATLTVTDAGQYTTAQQKSAGIDLWFPRGGTLDASVTDWSGKVINLNQPATSTVITSDLSPGGFPFFLSYDATNPLNDKVRITMAGRYVGNAPPSGGWSLTLTNNGTTPVTYEGWALGGWRAPFTNANGRFAKTVGIPGTAQEAISVGAYTTTTGGNNPTFGEIATFSAMGPTADGRIKPDISAPGVLMNAASSQDVTGTPGINTDLIRKSGTSMASPMVAGAVAQLLERNGALTQEQIRRGLAETARTDAQTGQDATIPNNEWGHGKLDAQALLEHDFTGIASSTWVRVRPTFYNWTIADTPPSFEIFANENGRASIELAWGSQDIPTPPALDPAEPLRYYQTGEELNVTITKADGSSMPVAIPEQTIQLVEAKATWTMPQVLWDAYREELRKGGQTPPASQMQPMLYYRVRFEPTGAGQPVVWPADQSFTSPLNNRMGIIGLNVAPSTQVREDQQAVDAMPRLKQQLEDLWDVLPPAHPDHAALMAIFTHRFFTNHIETEIRGKILTLWMLAGPARQRLHLLIERMHRNENGLEMTVFKQRCLRENTMLIDHLLELANMVPHPEIPGAQPSEQIIDDVLNEILDPNGQGNQGDAIVGVPAAIQTLMINTNAAEYVRLLRGLLSQHARTRLAGGNSVQLPDNIFSAILSAGAQGDPFLVRTNSECAFQTAVMALALGADFPTIDPTATANAPRGANTVLQRVMNDELTPAQTQTVLAALLGNAHQARTASPSSTMRNDFITALETTGKPMLAHLCWNAPHGARDAHQQAIVALRSEAGRVFFKNPRYAGSEPFAATLTANSSATMPPRQLNDPLQSLESMGSDDLAQWLTGYFPAV